MKITFTSAHNLLAQKAFVELTGRYGQSTMAEADVVVALGGDGHVMKTLYDVMDIGKPVFALRLTESVGFLCNDFVTDNLVERITRAKTVTLHPLRVKAQLADGKTREALAINEVTVIRETPQSARLDVSIDSIQRLYQYSGDGILVATPAGSTAYNHSCGGPIMPLDANTLVVTAISGYRPRRWTYAMLPQAAVIDFSVLEIGKRPVRIEAGSSIIRHVTAAKIWLDRAKTLTLMFDPEQHLGERIIREQFMVT